MRYERDGFSVEAAFAKNRPLPDDHWFWDEPPEIPGCEFFFEAFRDLQTCRHPEGAIPWTACRQWCRDKQLPADLADVVWDVVSQLDRAERGWTYEQIMAEIGGG